MKKTILVFLILMSSINIWGQENKNVIHSIQITGLCKNISVSLHDIDSLSKECGIAKTDPVIFTLDIDTLGAAVAVLQTYYQILNEKVLDLKKELKVLEQQQKKQIENEEQSLSKLVTNVADAIRTKESIEDMWQDQQFVDNLKTCATLTNNKIKENRKADLKIIEAYFDAINIYGVLHQMYDKEKIEQARNKEKNVIQYLQGKHKQDFSKIMSAVRNYGYVASIMNRYFDLVKKIESDKQKAESGLYVGKYPDMSDFVENRLESDSDWVYIKSVPYAYTSLKEYIMAYFEDNVSEIRSGISDAWSKAK